MSLPGPRFTYQDYCLMPEDKRYEVIEGELLVTPAPSVRHQTILSRIWFKVMAHVEAESLGRVLSAPTDVILSEENVVQPDVLFVAKRRQGILNPTGGVQGAPDLAVEILSPATAGRDRIAKRKLYGKYGVKEYWIVDPAAQTIEVLIHTPAGLDTLQVFPEGSVLASPLLPGLTMALTDVFAE